MERGTPLLSGLFVSATLVIGGCAGPAKPIVPTIPTGFSVVETTATTQPILEVSHLLTPVAAWVDPPIGWRIDKFDVDAQHTHVVWLSPTGDTAYGVVLMNLPLPVGAETILWGFLNHMRASDKRADLLQKQDAPDLPGLRFTAEGGTYRIRTNLTVGDWRAWAVYAGTLVNKPENPAELATAERARDGDARGSHAAGIATMSALWIFAKLSGIFFRKKWAG